VKFRFDPHWNELGHELYGRALADALEASGRLPMPEETGGASTGLDDRTRTALAERGLRP
jgi:hypothetical protein